MTRILNIIIFLLAFISTAQAYDAPSGTGLTVKNNGATLIGVHLGTPADGVATNLTGTATALNIGGNAATATTAGTLTTALSANQFLGSLIAVAPTGQTIPSCSTAGYRSEERRVG